MELKIDSQAQLFPVLLYNYLLFEDALSLSLGLSLVPK